MSTFSIVLIKKFNVHTAGVTSYLLQINLNMTQKKEPSLRDTTENLNNFSEKDVKTGRNENATSSEETGNDEAWETL